jgi:ferric-dicitrate binding protein FerR (iron transport regulator)
MSEDRLDPILDELRNESVPAEELAAARARVWEKLAGAESELCAGFRADLTAYAAGELESSRRLLLEDHLSRCAACRHAMAALKGTPKVVPMPVARRRSMPVWSRWAVAAGLAAMGLYLGRGQIDRAFAPSGPRATVVSVSGGLYKLPEGAMTAGSTVGDGEVVRTGYGAHAVFRLADGSLVEANERTEFAVSAAWSGQSIRLERGDIIVQAAKQRRGHLRVVTRDSTASVKGTIFAVSTGVAGSLVSVVEGSVEVTQPGGETLLTPGQTAASSASLRTVSAKDTIAWSQNAENYYTVLAELMKVEQAVALNVPVVNRTQARLLPYLPAGTFLYLAVPNPGLTLQEALAQIEARSQQSEPLRQWWAGTDRVKLKLLAEKLQTISQYVGDEVVVVLSRPVDAASVVPAVLAEIKAGQQAALEGALSSIFAGNECVYRISGSLLVVAPGEQYLSGYMARLGKGSATGFASEIASHYQRGVGLLCAIDVATASGGALAASSESAAFGVNKLKYLVFEQLSTQGSEELRAGAVFDGPRTGVASWLAPAGSLGSAGYVPSTAVMAISAGTRNPLEAYQEFSKLVGSIDKNLSTGIVEMESHTGVSLSQDILAALGTDFTFSIIRPTVPIPGWIGVMEVSQPERVTYAAKRFAEAVSANLAKTGAAAVSVEEQTLNGRAWVTLRPPVGPVLTWTYDQGYMIFSTDRDLAIEAISARASGLSLTSSAKFQAQLPASTSLHQSGFFWLNTQGPLADAAALAGPGPLQSLLASREPILVVVNGDTERIQAASRTRLMNALFTTMLAGRAHQATDASK